MHRIGTDWFLIRLDRHSERRTRLSLQKRGFTVFEALRGSRQSPLPGREEVSRPLVPGFCFVACPGRASDALPAVPGISWVLRHEKGRPLAIPGARIAQLETYCTATRAETIPAALRLLGVLAPEDRLTHLVDWLQSTARCTARTARPADAPPRPEPAFARG
jgi:hypothetical protein